MKLKAGLRSRSRSRGQSCKDSEVFGWSRNRILNNTGSRGRCRIFLSDSDSGYQIGSFLHHTPKLGILVETVQFLLKLMLKQRFLDVHHNFH